MTNKTKKTIQLQWDEYAIVDDLSQEQQLLLAEAKLALDKAHAPYSQFKVGAAVRLQTGKIVSGANFENAAYPMCLCAERSAIAAAISTQPDAVIESIAITVYNKDNPVTQPAAPCGACRQVMVEVEQRQQRDFSVLLQGESGPIWVLESAKSILPFYFDGSFL